ncbi:MAG: cyclic nucleotide-binding domain-containing protein, partial [Pseudomonadota bacterium]
TTLLEISKELIATLINEHPNVLKVILRFFKDRLIDTLTRTSELFAPFASHERKELASNFAFIEAKADVVLLTEGEQPDGLYILLSGFLRVTQNEGGEQKRLDNLGPGALFGEMALLTGGPSTQTIQTKTKCWLLKLDRNRFNEVIMTHPQVLAFVGELAEKRRKTYDAMKEGRLPYKENTLRTV